MYKIPPRTSSTPSPIRNILASQFNAATHNRAGIQAGAIRFVPKSRQVIFGSRIRGAKIRAEAAREEAVKAIRAADRAEAESLVNPNGGLRRAGAAVSHHRAMPQRWPGLPLDAIRRPRDTPIWNLEAPLKCRSCKRGRYAPPVHMIKLTETREITPYLWAHPDEER
jgi:hypothetical protein